MDLKSGEGHVQQGMICCKMISPLSAAVAFSFQVLCAQSGSRAVCTVRVCASAYVNYSPETCPWCSCSGLALSMSFIGLAQEQGCIMQLAA